MDASQLINSIVVSVIALSVIFLVLTILIFTIKILVFLSPYKAPPPAVVKTPPGPAARGLDRTNIAIITSTMATYLGKSTNEFQISNIKQL